MTAIRPRAGDLPRVLVRLDLLDPATGAVSSLRVANEDFADKVSQAEVYRGCLSLPPVIERSVGVTGLFDGGGAATARITIRNDGEFDQALTSLIWEGHPVQIYAGTVRQLFAEYLSIFTGTIRSVEWSLGEIEVTVEDLLAKLEREIQPNLYAGTGGYEGGADLAGIRKPICLGLPLNVPLVAVDRARNIYQMGDTAWTSIPMTVDALAIYNAGIPLTDDGTSTDLTSASVSEGQYKTDPDRGLVRLGGNIVGIVTADVEAVASGSPAGTATAASLAEIVLASRGIDTPSLDTASFTVLDSANSSDIGIYIGQGGSASQVLDTILASVGAFRTTTGGGTVSVRRLEAATASTADQCDLVLGDADLIGASPLSRLRRRLPQVPPWQIRVGYDRVWQVQNYDELAGNAIDAGRLDLVGNEYRYASVTSATTRTQQPDSDPVVIEAGLRGRAAAEAEAQRLAGLIGVPRGLYQCTVGLTPGTLRLGDQVWLELPRLGLDRGRAFRVVANRESARNFRSDLELFG